MNTVHILCYETSSYTVTKTTQNEALLWKITVLGKDKNLVGAGTFYTSPILVIYILYAGRVFRPQGSTFCRADAGRFRKSLKIKISGKNPGDLPHGEENPGLGHFKQIRKKV